MTEKENYPPLRYVSEEDFNPVEITSKPMDKEIIKALERLKSTKDYLRECYQNDFKNCKCPEIKPLIKDTYEDNKQAFDIAIKAIEDYNRQQAEIEQYRARICNDTEYTERIEVENRKLQTEVKALNHYYNECLKDLKNANAEVERLRKENDAMKKDITQTVKE